MIFLMAFTVAISIIYIMVFPQDIRESLWFIVFFQISVFLVPLGIWLAFFRETINMHLPHMRLGKTNIIYIIGLSFTLQPLMMLVAGLTSFFFPNQVSGMLSGFSEQYPLLMLILAIGVTPAICEEVVFRGYIQKMFSDKPFWVMAIVTALFFAIIHLNIHQFPYAFLMGIIFAYMVYATRSIRAAVISHFVLNASQVSLVWFLMRLEEHEQAQMGIADIATDSVGTVAGYYDRFVDDYGNIITIVRTAEETVISAELIAAYIFLGVVMLGAAVGTVILLHGFHKHNKKRREAYDEKIMAAVMAIIETIDVGEIETIDAKEANLKCADTEGEAKCDEDSEENAENADILRLVASASPAGKRKNFVIDVALVAIVIGMYVLLVIPWG